MKCCLSLMQIVKVICGKKKKKSILLSCMDLWFFCPLSNLIKPHMEESYSR